MNFFYEAVDQTGNAVVGKIEAINEAEVQQKLTQLGYRIQALAPVQNAPLAPVEEPILPHLVTAGTVTRRPILDSEQVAESGLPPIYTPARAERVGSITMAGNAARVAARIGQVKAAPARTGHIAVPPMAAPAAPQTSTLGGVKTRDLMFFFEQLSSLVNSGITIHAALDNLAPRTPNANLARTAREMAEHARQGGRVSDVMERYPHIYHEHIVGMVRAGELGGFLEIALAEIAENFRQNIALYRYSWIPKVMAFQALLVLAIAQPLFPNLFPNADIRLFLMLAARNLVIAGALLVAISFGSRRLQWPRYRRFRDEWSLRLPAFGNLQRQTAIATFLRVLKRLFQAGVSPSAAWEGAMQTATNSVIRERLAQSNVMMQQGASLPDAFAATGLFNNAIEQMIVTGHESGQVVEMLDQASGYYQQQAEDAVGKARFTMLRMGIIAMLVLGGGSLIWMTYSYFHGILDWVNSYFGEP